MRVQEYSAIEQRYHGKLVIRSESISFIDFDVVLQQHHTFLVFCDVVHLGEINT